MWISARQFLRFSFFDVSPFFGSGCKSRIVCRRRSQSYSGGDKSPPSISDTFDLSDKAAGKVHACPSQQVRKTDFVPSLFRLCLLWWLLHVRFVTHSFTYLIVWHAIRFLILSESVSLPFTSIWMRPSPYRISWSFSFRRKGNSGM